MSELSTNAVRRLRGKYRERTPVMVLDLTDRVWTVGDLLPTPLIRTATYNRG